MTVSAPSPLERLAQLFDKLEAFFEAARARHGERITCKAGCADCCAPHLSVTALEAEVIRAGLASLSPAKRRELAERARAEDAAACPALDPDGRCAIYAARPAICRTHGLPIRFAEGPASGGQRRLPVIDACPRNFAGQDLTALDPASVLDQATLSTVLGALDAAHAAAAGRPRGERVAIEAILAGA